MKMYFEENAENSSIFAFFQNLFLNDAFHELIFKHQYDILQELLEQFIHFSRNNNDVTRAAKYLHLLVLMEKY